MKWAIGSIESFVTLIICKVEFRLRTARRRPIFVISEMSDEPAQFRPIMATL